MTQRATYRGRLSPRRLRWIAVIGAKVVLSQLRLPYRFWQGRGLFKHGRMDDLGYAQRIFGLHTGRAFGNEPLAGKVLLEIGPGDSLATALIGHAQGAGGVILVDSGSHAIEDIEFYRSVAREIDAGSLTREAVDGAADLSDLLQRLNAKYLTAGLESLRSLPADSIDLIWSHSVLEHVPVAEADDFFREFHRILKPGGSMSHNIDFQDHLDHGLHNLRFSRRVWESALMRGGGFYTNRIRAFEMHRKATAAGFEILQEGFGRWPELPLARQKMAGEFQVLSDDELLVRTSHMLARKASPKGGHEG